jgi:hypothetical protein
LTGFCSSLRSETQRAEAALAKVEAQKEELHQAELKVESSAGDSLAKVAEMEVKLAETTLKAESSLQDLEVMRARGALVESLRAEQEQLRARLESSKVQQDAFKAEVAELKAQLKATQEELQGDRDSMSSLVKRGSSTKASGRASQAPPAERFSDNQKGALRGEKGGSTRAFKSSRGLRAEEEAVEGRKTQEEEEPPKDDAAETEDALGILPAFEATMIEMMKTTEEQVRATGRPSTSPLLCSLGRPLRESLFVSLRLQMSSMVKRLGLRVDAASLKVRSQEEAIKDVKQAKPRLLVQIQVIRRLCDEMF